MFSLGQANSTFFKYYLPVLEGFLLNVFRRFSCGLDARAPSERKTGISGIHQVFITHSYMMSQTG